MPISRLIVIFCFTFSALLAWAANPSVTATLDSNTISINDACTLSLAISDTNYDSIDFPLNTNDYEVIAQSSSSSFRFINGVSSQNRIMKYVIKAKHLGAITLPSITVKAGANTYSTEPLPLTVSNTPSSPPVPNNLQTQSLNIPPNPAPEANPRSPNKLVFARLSIDKANLFMGEKTKLHLKIYHKGNLRNLSLPVIKSKSLTIVPIKETKEYSEIYNGEEFLVYELSFTLTGIKTGNITIPPANIQALVTEYLRPNYYDPFDPFGILGVMGRNREIEFTSNPVSLSVKAIPQADSNFSGYIGNLNVEHSLKENTVRSGEAITIISRFGGNSNLALAKDFPFIKESEDYSIFYDKSSASNTVRTAVIPNLASGEIEITVLPIRYFDPSSGTYRETMGRSFKVKVLPNPKAKNTNQTQNLNTKKTIKKSIQYASKEQINAYQDLNRYEIYLWIILVLINLINLLPSIYKKLQNQIQIFRNKENLSLNQRIKNINSISELSQILKESEIKSSAINDFLKDLDSINYGRKETNLDLDSYKTQALELLNAK